MTEPRCPNPDCEMVPHLQRSEGVEMFYVRCGCGWEGPHRRTLEEALTVWRNRRAEPERPATSGVSTLLDLIERVILSLAKQDTRITALEARLATLETVAGYGPRAGDGYREIPAGERGEGDEG